VRQSEAEIQASARLKAAREEAQALVARAEIEGRQEGEEHIMAELLALEEKVQADLSVAQQVTEAIIAHGREKMESAVALALATITGEPR